MRDRLGEKKSIMSKVQEDYVCNYCFKFLDDPRYVMILTDGEWKYYHTYCHKEHKSGTLYYHLPPIPPF